MKINTYNRIHSQFIDPCKSFETAKLHAQRGEEQDIYQIVSFHFMYKMFYICTSNSNRTCVVLINNLDIDWRFTDICSTLK